MGDKNLYDVLESAFSAVAKMVDKSRWIKGQVQGPQTVNVGDFYYSAGYLEQSVMEWQKKNQESEGGEYPFSQNDLNSFYRKYTHASDNDRDDIPLPYELREVLSVVFEQVLDSSDPETLEDMESSPPKPRTLLQIMIDDLEEQLRNSSSQEFSNPELLTQRLSLYRGIQHDMPYITRTLRDNAEDSYEMSSPKLYLVGGTEFTPDD